MDICKPVEIGHYDKDGNWIKDGPWFDNHSSITKSDGYSYVECKRDDTSTSSE